MAAPSIVFNDGDAYERAMGVWSRHAGEVFLRWLAPANGLRWVDVGCGNGAFTELLMQRHAPAEVQGVDPSEGQLAYARKRPGAAGAVFHQGGAEALPFEADRFDAAVMALVLFFVPDPPKGVAEMARVVRPGGLVAAYLWDMPGGGFPFHPIQEEVRRLGITPPLPTSPQVSNVDALRAVWQGAGLEGIETRVIDVQRTYPSFENFWDTTMKTGSLVETVKSLSPEALATLQDRVRQRLPVSADGTLTYGARANAVKGRVPG